MSDIKHAEVTVVVHLPYKEHNDEEVFSIKHRARQLQEDPAFLASWYGVDADDLRAPEDCYVEVDVNLDVETVTASAHLR